MELQRLVVVAGHQYTNWGGLVSDCPQQMAIQSTGRYWLGQGNSTQLQLGDKLLIHNTDVGPRVNKAGKGVNPARQQEMGVDQ